MGDLQDRVALVTGGSRGIGRAIAQTLSRQGARVIITGLNQERLATTASDLSREGLAVEGHVMDVSDRNQVEQLVRSVVERTERLDILVNNAGITRDGLLVRMKPDDWSSVMATNLDGVFHCSQAVLRPMIRQRRGRIVNLSSVVGLSGNGGQTNYAASKAAILGFTKSLAREVASRNITVNAVAPGYIATDMTGQLSDKAKDSLRASIPLGRIGVPEEVATAVSFLVSDGAGYLTGQVLEVNGGMHM